jgi:UDP-glucose 4-epimerase
MISGVRVKFYEIDCCDKEKMRTIFENEKIDGVIHFAGLKAVGESCQVPLKYYKNNIDSTIALLELMIEYKVNNFIFSNYSSCDAV